MTDKIVTNFLDKLAGKEQHRAEAAAATADAVAAVLARTETPDISLDQVPQHSDDWLALIFTNRHADLRYCAAWNKWLRWDNTRWLVDETKRVFDLARKICREVAVECRAKDPQTAKQLVAAKRVAAVVMLAQSDRVHAATVDQWDADPWLLNTPDYVIDLRTGVQRTHSPEDYITRLAAVSPGGECRTWHTFLDRVTAGDKELQSFLQRVAGYSLTGITTRARAVLPLRHRRQRQERVHQHRRRHPRRLSQDGADRDLHGLARRSASDRPRRSCAARGSSPPSRRRRADAGPRAGSRR